MNNPYSGRTALSILQELPSTHSYRALRIHEFQDVYIALDVSGYPALFVTADSGQAGLRQRSSEAILEFGVKCSLDVYGQMAVTKQFHVLRCIADDPATVETFVLLLDALIQQYFDKSITGEVLSTFFRTLTNLFRTPPALNLVHERQGLWGELFVMQRVGGFKVWVPFWHSDPYKRFDFSGDNKRLEVKTTLGPAREHEFAHRQLFAEGDEQIVVASLILQPDVGGLSLKAMIDQSRKELSDDPVQLIKLERAVRAAAMGDPALAGPAFDAVAAATTLAWFWADDIPKFVQREPRGVSNTRYRVNLFGSTPISGSEIDGWLGEWSSHPLKG